MISKVVEFSSNYKKLSNLEYFSVEGIDILIISLDNILEL